MFLLLKLAFRNIFRNKRRTILSGIALGIGLASLIVFDAWVKGLLDNMISGATEFLPGHAQIHALGFRDSLEVDKTVGRSDEIMGDLGRESLVKAYAPRTLSYAMLTSTSDVSSILLYGVDAKREMMVSKLKDAVKKGDYDELKDTKIFIGNKLAENLSVDLGDRMVVTVAQAKTGKLSQEMFRVGGIYSFGVDQMDSAVAFIDLAESQKLLNLGSSVHEISLKFHSIKEAGNSSLDFWGRYSKYGNEALGWNRLFHDLEALIKIMDFMMFLSAIILFGIVSIGVVNTLFMSLYERMFEFGVLRAVGTRPKRMALLIVLEACALALLSITIGIVLGYVTAYWIRAVGIDFRGYEFNKVTIQNLVRPVIVTSQFTLYPLILFIFTFVASLYPAIHAARLKPAQAMRRSF